MRNLSNLFNSKTQKRLLFVHLWHFHKIINIANTSISKNKSFGKSRLICSYLVGSSQNFLKEILTHNFLGVEVGLKLFFFCPLEMVVGLL